jgi:Protein of unknown function (DUF3455)
MKRRFLAGLVAAAAVTASIVMVSGADAATPDPTAAGAQSAGVTPNGKLAAAIQVDETQNKVVLTLRGVGKQIYDCNAGGTFTTPAREPAAGLFTSRGIPAGIHGKGPFWTNFDGSHVDGSGAVSTPSTDPTKHVAWLRLVASSSPKTTGAFGNLTFIQRVDTRGGVPPTTCAAGSTVAVD